MLPDTPQREQNPTLPGEVFDPLPLVIPMEEIAYAPNHRTMDKYISDKQVRGIFILHIPVLIHQQHLNNILNAIGKGGKSCFVQNILIKNLTAPDLTHKSIIIHKLPEIKSSEIAMRKRMPHQVDGSEAGGGKVCVFDFGRRGVALGYERLKMFLQKLLLALVMEFAYDAVMILQNDALEAVLGVVGVLVLHLVEEGGILPLQQFVPTLSRRFVIFIHKEEINVSATPVARNGVIPAEPISLENHRLEVVRTEYLAEGGKDGEVVGVTLLAVFNVFEPRRENCIQFFKLESAFALSRVVSRSLQPINGQSRHFCS